MPNTNGGCPDEDTSSGLVGLEVGGDEDIVCLRAGIMGEEDQSLR